MSELQTGIKMEIPVERSFISVELFSITFFSNCNCKDENLIFQLSHQATLIASSSSQTNLKK